METPDHEKARVHFNQFLKLQRRGAMKRAAESLGIDRTHLSNWKSGKKDMGGIHVLHLMQHMAENGYPIKVESIAQSVPKSTVSELLASEFFAMGNTLASPFIPEELKRQKFLAFINGHTAGVNEWAALIKEQGGDANHDTTS